MASRRVGANKHALLALELVGLCVSTYLILVAHGLFGGEVPCPRGAIFACHSVLTGKYSKIGPVPIAYLGVLYFVVQLLLTGVLRKSGPTHALKVIAVLGGLGFAAWLRAVEVVYIKAICLWCWGVALIVLAEAFLVVPLALHKVRKLSVIDRIAAVIIVFLLLVGSCVAAAYLIAPPKVRRPVVDEPRLEPTPAIIQVTPKGTPVPDVAAKTPKPSPTPRVDSGEVRPEDMTAEEATLHSKGWTIVTNASPIERAIRNSPPVLMLTFKSDCQECQGFIYGALMSDALDAVPAKKLAIEEDALKGTLSDIVVNVPTLLLFNTQGKVVFKHEGRMAPETLKQKIGEALAK
jgi:uncharacterized membrane protein